jgi:hypothetical protein
VPFLGVEVGPARYLVTTRISSLLPDDATAVRLDQLDPDQAGTVPAAACRTCPPTRWVGC